jgi:hypothetical protein
VTGNRSNVQYYNRVITIRAPEGAPKVFTIVV